MKLGPRFAALGAAVAAVLGHLLAVTGGFTWLDHGDLEHGAAVRPPSQWLELFTHGFARTGFYRPLMGLSLSIDALAGKPWVFHTVNLLWHAAASALVVLVALAFRQTPRAALLAGVLFAVHPVQSLVAGALAYRTEALITCALLGLLLAHRGERTVAAAIALLAGALCKETVFALGPAFILALEWSSPAARPWRQRVPLFASEAAALLLAAGLRLRFASAWHTPYPPLSLDEQVGTRLGALSRSAVRVLWPVNAHFCDTVPVLSSTSLPAVAGLVILGLLAGLAIWKRGPALFLFLAVLPALGVVPAPRLWSPHYLYVPLAFAFMCVGALLAKLPRASLPVSVALGVGLSAFSVLDSARFTNDEALFGPEVAAEPRCREAQFYFGSARLEAGDLESAARALEAAAAPSVGVLSYVDLGAALQNLGVARLRQARYADAADAFRRALPLATDEPRMRELRHDLAASELSRGNGLEAARLLEPEAARADANRSSLLLYAQALNASGQRAAALEVAQRLGLVAPNRPQ